MFTQVDVDCHVEGYGHLWRVEETWHMLKRQQRFCNWFTKMLLVCIHVVTLQAHAGIKRRSSCVTAEFADALDIDLECHILRQDNYKGHKRELSTQSLRLPFDAWTLPALYVVVSCRTC